MLIRRISIQNYASYRDEQEIEFATGDKNVTIIEGQMGHGKSNLLNAFYWCLFNNYWNSDKAMFVENPDPIKYHLINKGELEDKSKHGSQVEVRVQVEFQADDQSIYTPTRSLIATNHEGKWECNNISIFTVGQKLGSTGQFTKYSDEEANGIIQQYFSTELSSYFLFRGENRDELIKLTGKSLFKEAITKLSKLRVFERLEDHLSHSLKLAQKELGKQYGGDIEAEIDRAQLEIDQYTTFLQAHKEQKDLRTAEKEDANGRYYKYKNLISKNAEASKVQNQIKGLELQINSLNNDLNLSLIERNSLITSEWPSIIAIEALEKAHSIYKKGIDDEKWPQSIKMSVLEKILEDKKCICGCDLSLNQEALTNIRVLQKQAIQDDIVLEIQSLASRVETTMRQVATIPEKIEANDAKKTELENTISTLDRKIQGLKPQITGISDTLKENQKKQDDAKEDIEFCNTKISELIRHIADSEKEISKRQEKIKDLKSRMNDSDLPVIRADLADAALLSARNLLDKYEKNIYEKIEKYMQSNWEVICYDILNYEEVVLNQEDKYFDVRDKNGHSRRLSMNTGHRLLLTISFIASLMKLAKETWGESFPIVMDAPLSEVGDSAMPKALLGLTKIFNQSIMILQDGTVSNEIKHSISSVLGKRYQITFDKKREHSIIKSVEV